MALLLPLGPFQRLEVWRRFCSIQVCGVSIRVELLRSQCMIHSLVDILAYRNRKSSQCQRVHSKLAMRNMPETAFVPTIRLASSFLICFGFTKTHLEDRNRHRLQCLSIRAINVMFEWTCLDDELNQTQDEIDRTSGSRNGMNLSLSLSKHPIDQETRNKESGFFPCSSQEIEMMTLFLETTP